MPRKVMVTNADCEPGRTIARVLEGAGLQVVLTRVPGIDALVNSYRLPPPAASTIEELDAEAFVATVARNLTEAFFASQLAASQMIAEGCRGRIVNVTSVAGVLAVPGQAGFCVSMSALTAASKVLTAEWARHGIRVATVGAGLSPELLAGTAFRPGRRVPTGAIVEPERVAETVRFVLSDAGGGIAGVPMYVDNGWMADGYWEAFP